MIFKFKNVIFSSALTFALNSCFNQTDCKKLELSKEEISWFTNYENGDTIFFETKLSEIDTFIVEVLNKPDYTVCNKFELGNYVYPTIFLRFQCLDNYPIEKRRKDYYLEFYLSNGDTSCQLSRKGIDFFELDIKTFRDFDSIPNKHIKYKNGEDSTKVFFFRKGENAKNTEGIFHIMEEFTISKEFGLVSYRTLKGDFYERVWNRKR